MLSVLVHFFEQGRWGSPVETAAEGQSLTAEDQLFILMQAAQHLAALRGLGAPEARRCYERAELLCHSLARPLLLYVALIGRWRYSFMTGKLTATMQVAERVYSLAQEQDDPALMIGAYRALAATLYFLGDFESALQYAMRGVQLWRSGSIQSSTEELYTPAVGCLCYEALSEWHLGDVASWQATIGEAISLAKELNDLNALALALQFAAYLAHYERSPTEVERLASELIELSTRHNFVYWLSIGSIFRGWARSASGDTGEGTTFRPKQALGVSGEESEAAELLETYRPDYFVSGHNHAFPYTSGQSWSQRTNGVCVLVPGQLLQAPFPNHIKVNTETGELSWHTASDTRVPEDGLYDHLVLKFDKD